ncbi:uncharacterized protein LOC108626516, partial [Ceratina calcarata]|uniref:Uncharacterized protein LOC108626516 n=1 Tax=Ceratina calcarata TaxID=156304 RepID=A0AAJ7N8E0_9HYME
LTTILKKLLSPNVGILYINYVFRFCFLGFMLVTVSTMNFQKYLIILYTVGALTQFYVLCFCMQELLEASRSIADDVIYETWYMYDMPLQHVTTMIVLGNKLECKLSSLRNIDLTLPSFMSVSFSEVYFFPKGLG